MFGWRAGVSPARFFFSESTLILLSEKNLQLTSTPCYYSIGLSNIDMSNHDLWGG